MAMQDPQAEPSMEEILASIRRIISEEESAPAEQGDVLDLTQQAQEEPETSQDDIVFDEAPEVAAAPAPEPAPEPVPAIVAEAPSAPEPTADTILSTPNASAAAGSLTRLAATLRISEKPGQTVEGVVRELLKPMLKEWLDQNLAAIVEARVEAELERIARMSR
jgi:cell pole-organizing protein PopZ